MKKLLFILLMFVCLLNCGFSSFEVGNNLRGENAEDKAFLDSLRYIPGEYFYSHYFLHPKERGGFTGLNMSNDEIDKKLIRSRKNNARHDSLLRQQVSEQEYAEYCQGRIREQKFIDFVESRLTPEKMEIVAQLRRLASEYSYIKNADIIIEISKEQALECGISPLAYDNYAEWVERTNKRNNSGELKKDDSLFWNYQIFFDDNIDDTDRDIVIRCRPK